MRPVKESPSIRPSFAAPIATSCRFRRQPQLLPSTRTVHRRPRPVPRTWHSHLLVGPWTGPVRLSFRIWSWSELWCSFWPTWAFRFSIAAGPFWRAVSPLWATVTHHNGIYFNTVIAHTKRRKQKNQSNKINNNVIVGAFLARRFVIHWTTLGETIYTSTLIRSRYLKIPTAIPIIHI